MKRLLSKLPPHKALIAFEAVMRLGTVTAAAKELTSTQPAVSQHLKNLELNLNTQLFQRRGRLLKATDEAKEFYLQIEPLLAKMAVASEKLRSKQSNRDLVNIVSNCGLAHFWLLPLLSDLQAAFPFITINITISDSADYIPDNAILLSFGEFQNRKSFLPIFTEQVCAVCSKNYATQHDLDKNSSLGDILQHPLVHLDASENRWLNWGNWLKNFNVDFVSNEPLVFLGNYHSVISATQKGQGIALGWYCLMQHLLDQNQLVQVGEAIVTRENHGYFLDCQNATSDNDWLVINYLKQAAAKQSVLLPD